MIRWIGLAPYEFEFHFLDSLIFTFPPVQTAESADAEKLLQSKEEGGAVGALQENAPPYDPTVSLCLVS